MKRRDKKCTEPELMNDLVDNMADNELHRAIREDAFVHANFPFEKLRVKSNEEKLTGPCKASALPESISMPRT